MNNTKKIFGPLGVGTSKEEIILNKENIERTLAAFSAHIKKARFLSDMDYKSIENLLEQISSTDHQLGYVSFWEKDLKTELDMFSMSPYSKGSYIRELSSKFFLQQEPKLLLIL